MSKKSSLIATSKFSSFKFTLLFLVSLGFLYELDNHLKKRNQNIINGCFLLKNKI